MMTDFFEEFGHKADSNLKIPKEIIEELDKDLPDNLVYKYDEKGYYIAVPKTPDTPLKITTKIDVDNIKDEKLKEKLRSIPIDKWPDYLWRSQKTVPIKNAKIGNDKQKVNIEDIIGNPLSDKHGKITDAKIYPSEEFKTTKVRFEDADGVKLEMTFKQQAYDSISEVKFSNIDFPALKIDIYIYSPLVDDAEKEENSQTNKNEPIHTKFFLKPTKAESVHDAITAAKISKSILTGAIKINGEIAKPSKIVGPSDLQKVDNSIWFWENAQKLEKKLNVNFDPRAEFSIEDSKLFYELIQSILENKENVLQHPFKKFHVSHFELNDGKTNFDGLPKDHLGLKCPEGPIDVTLLGATFQIYSITSLMNFDIIRIEWDDNENGGAYLYIKDSTGCVCELRRLFRTKKQFDEYLMKHPEFDNE